MKKTKSWPLGFKLLLGGFSAMRSPLELEQADTPITSVRTAPGAALKRMIFTSFFGCSFSFSVAALQGLHGSHTPGTLKLTL